MTRSRPVGKAMLDRETIHIHDLSSQRSKPNFLKLGFDSGHSVSGPFWLHRCFVKAFRSG